MTNDKFLNKKMKAVKIQIAIGVTLILLNLLISFLKINIGEFWPIMLDTWGLIFVVMGVARFLMYRNDSILKYYKIAECDERNDMLRGKAGYVTFAVSIILLAIVSVIFVSMDLMAPAIITLAILFAQYILFLILMWYYSKKL